MQMPELERKKIRNANRNSVRIIVLVYVLVHLAFGISGALLSNEDEYTVSPFRTPQSLSSTKSISLIRWDYAPREDVMEVVFDIEDSAYSKGSIQFTAMCHNKNLDSQVVYNDEDMLILQLYDMPREDGLKIAITFEYTPASGEMTETSFYSYIGAINLVDTLPVLSQTEYYVSRQEYDIAYYQSLISGVEKSIEQKESSITEIEEEITRLQSKDKTLTTDEMLNLQEHIQNNQDSISALESQISELKVTISDYQAIIKVLEERKAKYE